MKNKLLSVLFALVLAVSAVIPVSAASESCSNGTQSSSPSSCTFSWCNSGNAAFPDCDSLQECLKNLPNCETVLSFGSCADSDSCPFNFGSGTNSSCNVIPSVPEASEVPDAESEQPNTPAEAPTEQPSTPAQTPAEQPSTPAQVPAEQPSSSGNTSGSTGSIQSFEQQVADLVNEQRAANGLAPLTINAKLCDGARMKSQDMHDAGYFSHTSPNYGSPFDMMSSLGITYSAAGENIAMGYSSPEAVMNGWMNSEGHRANILSNKFTSIGVGYVADGNYWTQWFIS